jgi:predicted 2-oxoglutarate/Fe(II)-dependent dioxygenase YbiX
MPKTTSLSSEALAHIDDVLSSGKWTDDRVQAAFDAKQKIRTERLERKRAKEVARRLRIKLEKEEAERKAAEMTDSAAQEQKTT